MIGDKVNIDLTKDNRWERIWLLAKIEFKLRYYENKLGLFWALLKPLLQLAIYFVAFKIIMRNNIDNYAIYLFAGIIVWQFFAESTGGLTSILRTKKYLYEYSNMSKIEIYMASMISISLGFAFNFVILLVFLLLGQIEIGLNILFFPLVYFILVVFCFGVALILSNLFLLMKDINQFWPLLTQFLMWLSPLFFAAEALKSSIPFIDLVNPMYGLIANFRNVVMYNMQPDYRLIIINVIQAGVIFVVGMAFLKVFGARASEKL